LNKTLLHQKLV